VHAPAPNLALHLLLPILLAGVAVRLGARAVGIRQVLNNRAVDRELVPALAGVFFLRFKAVGRGRGFGYEGLQDAVDYCVVPGCGAFVLVACGGCEGGVAGVGGYLGEAGGGDGLVLIRVSWVVDEVEGSGWRRSLRMCRTWL
jgi:hypothetical protein